MQEEVAWQQKEVTVHGKTVMQPRLLAYMGDDPSLAYTYSRQTMVPEAWTPAVRLVKVIHVSPHLSIQEIELSTCVSVVEFQLASVTSQRAAG